MTEALESLQHLLAQYVALFAETVAILLIAVGCVEAVINIFRVTLPKHVSEAQKREVWLKLAQWLVAALTFQLAADIVNTSLAPGWEEVGRLAAVAVIRTFLSYFLDREVEHTRELQKPERPASVPRA